MVKQDTLDTLNKLEECIERLKKRSDKLKKNIAPIEETKVEPKKKEAIKPKKEYKSFMKVASIFVIFGLLTLLVASAIVPDVKEVIMAIIEALKVFSIDDSPDLEYFANFKI